MTAFPGVSTNVCWDWLRSVLH